MVSVYQNPLPGQDFYSMGDPMKMDLPGLHLYQPGGTNGTGRASNLTSGRSLIRDDPNKKVRKPYTITKSRESWTEQEHDKFLEALQLFDRDWKKIEAFVGSKNVIQIRSHAQKYFLKVQKSGTSEHVPPPRPKRKAAHPYPQKAPKIVVVSQVSGPFHPPAAFREAGFAIGPDSLSVPGNSINNAALSSWNYNDVPAFSLSHMTKVSDDSQLSTGTMMQNCSSSSNESMPRVCTTKESKDQEKEQKKKQIRVMPDFAQVYSFIGSVFDPSASDHLRRLKEMDPIDVETVLMLMKNLSFNLRSPEFEDHRRLLSSYSSGDEKDNMNTTFTNEWTGNPIPTA